MKEDLLEMAIKIRVLEHLRKKRFIDSSSTIINEFVIDNASRRVDLAIFDGKYMYAIEIKSEKDSLHRLEGQIETYLKYFDKLIVIAATKHIESVKSKSPNCVEVWEVSQSQFKIVQRGKLNPVKVREHLFKFMRVDELLNLSKELGLNKSQRSRRSLLSDLNSVPIRVIRTSVIKSLKDRYKVPNELFWKMSDTEITKDNVRLLSLRNVDGVKSTQHNHSHQSYIDAITSIS